MYVKPLKSTHQNGDREREREREKESDRDPAIKARCENVYHGWACDASAMRDQITALVTKLQCNVLKTVPNPIHTSGTTSLASLYISIRS